MDFPVRSSSPAETRAAAAGLVATLPEGAIVTLEGDLGAGKTEFVRGLVAGLGGSGHAVTSPTFTIAQQYRVDSGIVIHVDAYRVESEHEIVEMGLEEYLETAVLAAIEWPDRLGAHRPEDAVGIRISHGPGGLRLIERV